MPDEAGAAAHYDGADVDDDDDSAADGLRNRKLVKFEEHTVSPEKSYLGVAMCRDGRVILNSSSSSLFLYDPVTRTVQTLTLSSVISSAVQIDDTHIAVSCPFNKTITIVAIGDELRVEKILQTRCWAYCIVALNNGQLAVAWYKPPAFGVIDVSGTQVVEKSYMDRDTNGRKFQRFRHLAVDERRQHVIHTCYNSRAVNLYCFDFKGNQVFKYSHPETIRPTGVALDKDGNIYVCVLSTDSIHKLSPTGDLISVIKLPVPHYPVAICSDVTGTGFWVTPLGSSTIVYIRLHPIFKYLCLRELHSPFIWQ